MERARASNLPTAFLNIDLEKVFDCVWISGILFKLRNYNIAGRMIQVSEAFLRNRQVSFEPGEYKSHTFPVVKAVPQGAVLSPLLCIKSLNDILINEGCSFRFADDSSYVVTSETADDLTRKLALSCAGLERWCSTSRMVVNSGKTEIDLLVYEASDIKHSMLNGDACQIKSHTKSLGMLFDNQLTYRQHAEATSEKPNR